MVGVWPRTLPSLPEEKDIREAKDRAERITAMGMLLDANWSNSLGLFVKITRSLHPNGIASRLETFYNETGEEVPRPKGR